MRRGISRQNVLYALTQIFTWAGFGVLIGYSHVYLLGLGLSNTLVSVLMAASSVVSVVLQMALTRWSTEKSGPAPAGFLCVLTSVLGVSCLLMLMPLPGAARGALLCIAALLLQMAPAFINTQGVAGMQQGYSISFGVARGLGSVAYSFAALAAGPLIEQSGTWIIPAMSAFFAFSMLLWSVAFSRSVSVHVPTEESEPQNAERGFFRSNPGFSLFLCGCISLFVSHNLLCNFMYQIAVAKGGGETEQGMIQALSAALELPTMFLFTRMVRRWRCDCWVRLSAAFFALRALGMLLAPGIPGCLAAQLAQPFGFALYSVSATYYVGSIVPPAQVLQGQSYLFSASTLGSIGALVIGGPILDGLGVQMLLFLSVCFGLAGGAIFIMSVRRVDRVVGTVK